MAGAVTIGEVAVGLVESAAALVGAEALAISVSEFRSAEAQLKQRAQARLAHTANFVIDEFSQGLSKIEDFGARAIKKIGYKRTRSGRSFASVPTPFPTLPSNTPHPVVNIGADDEMKEDDDGLTLMLGTKGSFSKSRMPRGRRGNRGKRRNRRKSKAVTVRGVKQLIRQEAIWVGPKIIFTVSDDGGAIFGDFGNWAGSVKTFFNRQVFDVGNNIDRMIKNTAAPFFSSADDRVGGVDQPQLGNFVYHVRKHTMQVLIHNNVPETCEANIWWCLNKQDTEEDPLEIWTTEYDQQHPASGPLDNTTLTADFMTFPTEFKEWKTNYHILKKFRTSFAPGETKKLFLKFRNIKFQRNQAPVVSFIAGMTHHFMIQGKGVPTIQNDSVTVDPTQITRSRVGFDIIFDERMELGGTAQRFGMLGTVLNLGTVTEARSINPSDTQIIRQQ